MKLAKFKGAIGSNRIVKGLNSQKTKKLTLIAVVILFGIVLIIQISYPRDRALPYTSVSGQPVGTKTRQQVKKQILELYDRSTVEVIDNNKTMLAQKASVVGAEIETDKLLDKSLRYTWWQRLIPGSVLWQGLKVSSFPAKINQPKLNSFIDDNLANFTISAENAKLVIEKTKVNIAEEIKGSHLSKEQFVRGVTEAKYKLGEPTKLKVKFSYTEPVIKKSDLKDLQKEAQAIMDKKLNLKFDDLTVPVDAQQIADWLKFEQQSAVSASDIKMNLDQPKVSQFVKSAFDKKVVQPAGVTEVYLVDGVEQSRKPGANGRAVDESKVFQDIQSTLLGSKKTPTNIEISTQAVSPKIKNNHSFTKSQRGLQAYFNSLSEDGDIRVSLSQIGGRGWQASYRGAEQIVAASTYKVYVVAYALNQIAEDKLSYDDSVNGQTMRQCIEKTIVNSDNACPEAMMEKFGRTRLNNFLYERGYSRATTFTDASASQTSASDLTKAMTEIDNGKLINGKHREFMLGLMGRQVYRQGVPTGSGADVQNKVGFLWSYLNDTAIVNHPSGKYVITVMTNNQSWAKIAEITRQAESLMY